MEARTRKSLKQTAGRQGCVVSLIILVAGFFFPPIWLLLLLLIPATFLGGRGRFDAHTCPLCSTQNEVQRGTKVFVCDECSEKVVVEDGEARPLKA